MTKPSGVWSIVFDQQLWSVVVTVLNIVYYMVGNGHIIKFN